MIEEKILELGYDLPDPPKPLAVYIPAKIENGFGFTAGQIPMLKGELKYAGKVGLDLTLDEGKEAAKLCALNCLSALKGILGALDRIESIVKVTVFVNSSAGFTDQPVVANGASELLGEIFGENGRHVRSAVGVNELPINSAVEVEMIVKLAEN